MTSRGVDRQVMDKLDNLSGDNEERLRAAARQSPRHCCAVVKLYKVAMERLTALGRKQETSSHENFSKRCEAAPSAPTPYTSC